MGREMEELQFIGFFGIFVEASRLIATRGKLFFKIALSLVLPMSVFGLADIHFLDLFVTRFVRNASGLEFIPRNSPSEQTIVSRVLSDLAAFLLFRAVSLVTCNVFWLLSTGAVVFTATRVYTAKDASFRKFMKVLPKVWKRLMVTFLCSSAILFICNFFFLTLLIFLVLNMGENFLAALLALIVVFFYLFSLIYINIVWCLAYVVSLLEDIDGITALQKSKNLLTGRKLTVVVILVVLQIPFTGVGMVFGKRGKMGSGVKVVFVAMALVVLTFVILVQLVVQTVVYFVCKSYHHESIEKECVS